MIVECGHCGAPLDVDEHSTIVKCRYCRRANERTRVRTIAEQTPEDFAPPKKWKPPAEFEADSTEELTYKSDGLGWKIGCLIVGFTVGLPIVIGIGTCAEESTGFLDTNPSKLAVALDGSPEALGKTLGGKPSDLSLYVELHNARYKYVSLSWDQHHMGHPTSFAFARREEKAACDPEVLAKLSAALRGGLDSEGSWRWEHLGVSCAKDSGMVSANVRPDDDPMWEQQLDATWKLVISVLFGLDVKPSQPDTLLLLGAGYPFADVVKVSPATPINQAAVTVRKQFPGALIEERGEIDATIPVDHPLFRSAKMRWLNMRDAGLYSVDLEPLGAQAGFAPKRDALATCLSKSLGAARTLDADFMKGTKAYSWSFPSMSVNLNESFLTLSTVMSTNAVDPTTYANVLHAVGECH